MTRRTLRMKVHQHRLELRSLSLWLRRDVVLDPGERDALLPSARTLIATLLRDTASSCRETAAAAVAARATTLQTVAANMMAPTADGRCVAVSPEPHGLGPHGEYLQLDRGLPNPMNPVQ